MIVFADASALVKLYVPEADHEQVRGLEGVVIAQLSRVEVCAAFWRKVRMRELDAADAALLVGAFEADYFGTQDDPGRFSVLSTSVEILDTAARHAAVHGLRAYDAVQLASASALVPIDAVALAAFDTRLRVAAAAEGMDLIP